ncbi:MAG TPA: CDP-glycerol glycerophosphotransferase family protein [Aeromicrobium sp.]|nr:CDP-glycerol glycerophosphotransferase family protein [Aeromicrobium sp.]
MSEPELSFLPRLQGSYDRRRTDLQHRFRTNVPTRRKLFIRSTLALIVVGAVALAFRGLGGQVEPAAIAATVLGVVLVRLAMLRPPTPPHAHGLPGLGEPKVCPAPEPADRGPFVLTVRWLGAVAALAVALTAPVVLVWLLVGLLAVAAAVVIVDKVKVWQARRAIRAALTRLEPKFVLAYGGHGGGPIHVGMWEPHLMASGDRGAIFSLREHYCAELRAGIKPKLPWIQVGSDVLGDLRLLAVPSITTFFYVHNAPGHLKFLGVPTVRHVWLGHGDSDKSGSYHPRHLRYDVLVASGEAAIDRYVRNGVDIPRERFVLLGRPQSGDVLPAVTPVTQVARPTVLYAPTWPGNSKVPDFSSITLAEQIFAGLIAAGANIIFRPHPVFLRSGKWATTLAKLNEILAADTADPNTAGQHLAGEEVVRDWSIADCMNRADALVSDVSSVVSDWLASAKPYLMISMVHSLDEFATEVPVAAGAYVVDRHLSSFDAVVDQMLHSDPLKQQRQELKVRVLGDYEGTESAEAFSAWVHQTVNTPYLRQ